MSECSWCRRGYASTHYADCPIELAAQVRSLDRLLGQVLEVLQSHGAELKAITEILRSKFGPYR